MNIATNHSRFWMVMACAFFALFPSYFDSVITGTLKSLVKGQESQVCCSVDTVLMREYILNVCRPFRSKVVEVRARENVSSIKESGGDIGCPSPSVYMAIET